MYDDHQAIILREKILEQVGYEIVHSIAGRIRIRVPWLETDEEATSKYQRLLEALSYVNGIRINPMAQSIVITYNSKQLRTSEAQELFIAAMQQVKPTPPATVATVETEPEPEPNREPTLDRDVQPTPVIITEPPKPQPSPPKTSPIPEIPSPWDEPENPISAEEIEPAESAKAAIDPQDNIKEAISANPVSEPPAVALEVSEELAHSTTELAKRLGVTSQAITRRRTKIDFAQWTQAQDPDRIAWNYHEASRLFYPVEQALQTSELEDSQEIDAVVPTIEPETTKRKSVKQPSEARSTRKNRKS